MHDIIVRAREGKTGKTYTYQFEIASVDGKRKYATKGGFKTKTEAKEAGKKAQQEYENLGIIKKDTNLSCADLFTKWLEVADLKPSTKVGYEKKIRNYINPVIGHLRANAIEHEILQNDIINVMYDKGFSRNTISSVAGILTQAFIYSNDYLKIPKRFAKLTVPKHREKAVATREEPHIYITKEQFETIIERFPEGTTAYIPLLLGYRCGLRLGETFGITWEDVDLENKTLYINRQVQWLQFAKAGTVGRGGVKRDGEQYGYWYFTDPKYNSKRLIDLDDFTVEVLKREKTRQEKAKAYLEDSVVYYDSKGNKIGKTYTNYYINQYDNKEVINTDVSDRPVHFVMSREDGTYISPRIIMHVSTVIRKQLGIDEFDYHSLRHTHATDIINSEQFTPKYVQIRMGHRNIQTTLNIYTHLTEEKRKKEAAKLNDIY